MPDINSDIQYLKGVGPAYAKKFAKLGMDVVELPTLEAEVQENLMHRPGGSVSLAVGMAHIFSKM